MVCNPNDNSLNPPFLGPPSAVPGFGIPFTTPRLPLPIQIPEGIPEDIIALVESLLARLPGGILKPNPHNEMKDVWDAIAQLLSQVGPFLALYSFFQALLNMVLCIIDVLCALMSPWKARRAIKRLFKRCIPDFISLFPWIALVAMIISLILLLLALIEYIINTILAYINDIIRNLQILAEAVQLDDSESVIAAARKISYLLCLIEQIFAILIAFAAILEIIRALLSVQGRSVCGKGASRQGDDNDCCTDDVCPPFIADNEDGVVGTAGTLKYLKQRTDITTGSVIRAESYQFYDETTGLTYNFSDIITPIDGATFWPDNLEFDTLSSVRRIPYFIDMRISVNPASFGHADTEGERFFRITGIIVEQRPYLGVYQYNNALSGTQNGTLSLVGGLVYEDDGVTPYAPSGSQLTLNSFIFEASTTGAASSDDSINFSSVEYTLQINHDALVAYMLINIMCVPDVAMESLVLNTSTVGTFGIGSTAEKIENFTGNPDVLPDVSGAVNCLQQALSSFRENVSIENAAVFQADVTLCLNTLKTNAEDSFVGAVVSGTDLYKSTIQIDPEIQFINTPIDVLVQLKDGNNVIISSNIPASLGERLAQLVTGHVTGGSVSAFAYNNDLSGFSAQIISQVPVAGVLTVTFNDELLNTIVNRDNLDETTAIEPLEAEFRFIGALEIPGYGDAPRPRRDEGDVSEVS